MRTKLQTLVASQLPEFIRDDYQTFVSFIEAYYAWMEQSGNVLERNVQLLRSVDIDSSLDEFIDYFCKEFIPNIPENIQIDKNFLITHAKEIYKNKGTEKSYKLLFKLLFDSNIEINYGKNEILVVSDGKWKVDKSLRLQNTLYSTHFGNGTTKKFRILGTELEIKSINVYVDDVLQTGSDFIISKNTPNVIFNNPPANNSTIKIEYSGKELLNLINANKLIFTVRGLTSGATAISENAEELFYNGITLFSLHVSSIVGNFINGETIELITFYDTENNLSLTLKTKTITFLDYIEILDGGANYNVGDIVPISGGTPVLEASAVIEEIYSSIITDITILSGGCGYQVGQSGYITSTPNTGLTFAINAVDKSGRIHPNSYPINTDVLSLFDNVIMSNSNYGFYPSGNENATTILANVMNSVIFGGSGPEGLGPITNVSILISTETFSTTPTLKFDSPIVTVTGNTANVDSNTTANVSIGYFGILGRLDILNGGSNYQVGDEIVITNVPGIGIGIGAAAEVTEVHSSNSGIKTITFQPSRIDGTVNASGNIVIGTGTNFTEELKVNNKIKINNETSFVETITNNNYLILNTNLTRVSTNRKLGVYDKYFIGGINYSINALPTITVSSGNISASGANIMATGVISGGESLLGKTNEGTSPGEIKKIRIISPGYGYNTTPIISLTSLGDGKANALAVLISTLFVSEGHFLNHDGMLSSNKKLQNIDIFNTHAYTIKSAIELKKYKNIFKSLVHPIGMELTGIYFTENVVNSADSANTFSNVVITTP